jgi:TolB-like protein
MIAVLAYSTQAMAASHQPSVLLLPPTMINAAGQEWVGDSLQQSLQADIHHASVAHAAAPAADDSAAMARLARNASVDWLVQTHVQFAVDQIRLTATVFNDTGKPIGAAKATGDLRHLFDVEDALAEQIADVLGKARAASHPITTPIPVVEGSGPLKVGAPQVMPIGTVPVAYSSEAMRDGHDRYIYQVPVYGCYGGCGYGGFGYCGYGFGGGYGGFSGVGYSTFGGHGLAW